MIIMNVIDNPVIDIAQGMSIFHGLGNHANSYIYLILNTSLIIDDNAIELARTLLCLENTYELEGFQDRRERGLVALAVALPGDVVR